MSVRDARWYLENDRSGLVAGIEARLDELDLERNEVLRHRHAETVERMKRLGLDDLARRMGDPTPRLDPRELYASRHPTSADVERFERERRRTARRRRMTEGERDELASLSDFELARRVR